MHNQFTTEPIWYLKPAWWFKVWWYIIEKCNKSDNGKAFFTLEEIYTQCHLSKEQITKKTTDNTIRWLKSHDKLTTEKTTGGMFITISSPYICSCSFINKNDSKKEKRTTQRRQRAAKKNDKDTIKEIIDYLNQKCKTRYREKTPNNIQIIRVRLKEGFSVEDFKKVIDIKAEEWMRTERQKYLRPQTLFGTKFESYLNQQVTKEINQNFTCFECQQRFTHEPIQMEHRIFCKEECKTKYQEFLKEREAFSI